MSESSQRYGRHKSLQPTNHMTLEEGEKVSFQNKSSQIQPSTRNMEKTGDL